MQNTITKWKPTTATLNSSRATLAKCNGSVTITVKCKYKITHHNKYWSVTTRKLMTKTSFFDDRQELTETYWKPAEHLHWSSFPKIVYSFKPLTNFAKKPMGYFRLGSKYTFGLPYEQKICRSEFANPIYPLPNKPFTSHSSSD